LIYSHEFYPFHGGIASWTMEIARGLNYVGHEVIVLAPDYLGMESDAPRWGKFKIQRMPFALKGRVSYFIGIIHLFYIVFTRQIDAIVLCDAISHIAGALSSFFINRKFVVIFHGTEILQHFSNKNIWQKAKSKMIVTFLKESNIITNSEATKRLLLKKGGHFEHIHTVYCSISDIFLKKEPKSTLLIKNLNLEGRAIVLTVARLYSRKGHDMVIRAMTEVVRRIPDAVYLIVGDGVRKKVLENLISSLKLDGHVLFVGEVDDVIDYLDICNVFVMASREEEGIEGLGISYLEAMSRRKPVIGGNHGGVPEIIEHGVNGFLVDPRNVIEISKRIIDILLDPILSKQLGDNGRKIIESRFTTSIMTEKLLNVIKLG